MCGQFVRNKIYSPSACHLALFICKSRITYWPESDWCRISRPVILLSISGVTQTMGRWFTALLALVFTTVTVWGRAPCPLPHGLVPVQSNFDVRKVSNRLIFCTLVFLFLQTFKKYSIKPIILTRAWIIKMFAIFLKYAVLCSTDTSM